MTRLGTILRRQVRPIRDLDRFSLTPAGLAALEDASAQDVTDGAEAALEGAQGSQEPVQSVRQAYDGPTEDGQPKPEWVRGECPQCGGAVVANCYYVGGLGYLTLWECWLSLGEAPSCGYRKVL